MRTNRRKFFAKAGASAAALTLATSQGAAAAPASTPARASGVDKDGPILKIGDSIAVADTSYGYTNNCRYLGGVQRVDIPIVRNWIMDCVADLACPSKD